MSISPIGGRTFFFFSSSFKKKSFRNGNNFLFKWLLSLSGLKTSGKDCSPLRGRVAPICEKHPPTERLFWPALDPALQRGDVTWLEINSVFNTALSAHQAADLLFCRLLISQVTQCHREAKDWTLFHQGFLIRNQCRVWC